MPDASCNWALEGCPVADEVILCVSELATNAVLHTASGKGGQFEVILQQGKSWVHVAACDEGSNEFLDDLAPARAEELHYCRDAAKWADLTDAHSRALGSSAKGAAARSSGALTTARGR
jgi:hypothetical protein